MGWLTRILVLIGFTAHIFVAVTAQALPLQSSGLATPQDQPNQGAVHSPDHDGSLLFTLSRAGDGNVGLDRARSTPSPVDRVGESTDCLSGTTGDCGFSLVSHSDRHACRSSLAFFGRLIPLRN